MPMPRVRTRAAIIVMAAAVAGGGLLAGVAGATQVPEINTVAGNGTPGSSGNGGLAVKAQLNDPTGVALDGAQDLYIADTANNEVREVINPASSGQNQDVINAFAGVGGRGGYGGDGGLAVNASLNVPSGLAVSTMTGNVYIADTGNNRIRMVNTSGKISTVAGNGTCSSKISNGGLATSASLCAPTGIGVDSAGNLYIADTGHNVVREVVASTGDIQAFAGSGAIGSSGNGGTATKAQLFGPTGIAADAIGDVYIADTGNSEIRAVAGGVINAFAGQARKFGYGGDGLAPTKATLDGPTGVGVDPSGNVYISDTGNSRIRAVMNGTISTYAGTGKPGFSGDLGPATAAQIDIPVGGIAANGANVYFSDTGNQRVRGIFTGPPPVLPQSSLAILLPISAGVIIVGAGTIILLRRRRTALRVTA